MSQPPPSSSSSQESSANRKYASLPRVLQSRLYENSASTGNYRVLASRTIRLLPIAIQKYTESPDFKALKTPQSDQECILAYARSRGCLEDNIRVMSETSPDQDMLPTRGNILKHIAWLVRGSGPCDLLIFHYSGHGHQVDNRSGTEVDGKDEAIVTMDKPGSISKGVPTNLIIDNVLRKELVDPLPLGVTLLAILDACNSGTLLDLDSPRKRKISAHRSSPLPAVFPAPFDPNITSNVYVSKRARRQYEYFPSPNVSRGRRDSQTKPQMILAPLESAQFFASPERSEANVAEVICLSACRDGQNAWAIDHRTFTYYVVELLQKYQYVPISPLEFTAELHVRLSLVKMNDIPASSSRAADLMKLVSRVQIAQVTTLAGNDHLLGLPFYFPRPSQASPPEP